MWRSAWRRLLAKETLLCALALLPGSIFVFAQLPPLWRDNDSIGQLTSPPGHFILLQFPALYPFVSRVPLLLISGLTSLAHGTPLHVDPQARVLLNDGGIYLLIVAQHLALLFSLALFVVTVAQGRKRRVLIILLALITPVLFLSAQLISSEALGVILMIILLAGAVHIFREKTTDWPTLTLFGICLYLNIMTRHVSAVFAALLPLGFLCALVRARSITKPLHLWRNFFRTVTIGLLAICFAYATTFFLCVIFREPYRSIVSRTAVYRLDEIDHLPPAERAAFIQTLQDKADDPLTKEAIPIILEAKGYWSRSLFEIERLIEARYPPMRSRERHKLADTYLTKIIRLFYSAAPPFLLENTRTAIINSFRQTNDDDVSNVFLKIGLVSLQVFRESPRLHTWTAGLTSCSAEAAQRITAFADRRWLSRANKIPCGFLLIGSTAVATVLAFLQRLPRWRLHALCAILLTDLLLMIGTFAISPYSERQILPACIFAFASIALLLGGVGQRCEN